MSPRLGKAVAAALVVATLSLPMAARAAPAGAGSLECPARLAGLALDSAEFQPLPNNDGVVVETRLTCSYPAPGGDLLLEVAWSPFASETLGCEDLELSTESGPDRISGALDSPTVRARASFEIPATVSVEPAENAARRLLADVPDALACDVAAANVAQTDRASPDSDPPLGLVAAGGVGAALGGLLLVAYLLTGRRGRKSRRAASAPTPLVDPDLSVTECWRRVADLDAQLKDLTAAREQEALEPAQGSPDPGHRTELRSSHVRAVHELHASHQDGANHDYVSSYAGRTAVGAAAAALISVSADQAADQADRAFGDRPPGPDPALPHVLNRLDRAVDRLGEHHHAMCVVAHAYPDPAIPLSEAIGLAREDLDRAVTTARRGLADPLVGATAGRLAGAHAEALASLAGAVAETGLGDPRYRLWMEQRARTDAFLEVMTATMARYDRMQRHLRQRLPTRPGEPVGGGPLTLKAIDEEIHRVREALRRQNATCEILEERLTNGDRPPTRTTGSDT